MRLTKESDALLCLLYKEFLEIIKSGTPRKEAKELGGSEDIQRDHAPKWSPEDVDELCRELHRFGMLDVFYAGDIAYVVRFSDAGIVYMENRFKDGLLEILDHLQRIRDFLPF